MRKTNHNLHKMKIANYFLQYIIVRIVRLFQSRMIMNGSRLFVTVLASTRLVVFIIFLEPALFLKAVIILFRQLLKWLTCKFSTWSGQWRVLIKVNVQLFNVLLAHISIA